MRPFKELYDNKNHADLRELEKFYDRFRDTVRTLFKKVDQAADEAEPRYLMETVREIEQEGRPFRYISAKELEDVRTKASLEATQGEIKACIAAERDFLKVLRELMEAGVLPFEEADFIANAAHREAHGQNGDIEAA